MDAKVIKDAESLMREIKSLVGEEKEFEICLRDMKKNFKSFYKFMLNTVPEDNRKKEAVEMVMKAVNKKMDIANANIDKLLSMQELSIGIQGLGVFIGMANLCVTAAGFAIMNKKLNKISKEINEVLNTMKTIHGIQLDFEFEKVLSEYKDMLDHKKTKTAYSEEKYRKLIDREYTVLKLLHSAFMENTISNETSILYAITSLSNMLSVTICNFDEVYYFAHREVTSKDERWHTSHDSWMEIFEKLNSKVFLSRVQDFAFLDEGLSQYKTDLLVASFQDSFIEAKKSVSDKQCLIQYLDSLQQYKKTQELLNQYLINQIEITVQKKLKLEEQQELYKIINNSANKMGLANY